MKRPPTSQIKAVIFDFDGTLADSLEALIAVGQELLQTDWRPSKREMQELRGLKPLEILKRFEVKPWHAPKLLLEGRKLMAAKTDMITIYPGVPVMLKELKDAGYQLYVVSTNSKSTISAVLRRFELNKYISGTDAGGTLAGKAVLIRKLMKKKHLIPAECVYVGDEVRDIEAARKAKTRVVSVTWGYNSAELLRSMRPDKTVSKPSEIAQAIKQLD